MQPGQSRIIRELPCPPDMMSRPNEYYLLGRAATRLMEHFDFWNLAEWRNYQDAVLILKRLREAMPIHPCKAWSQSKLGIVYEICCPNCDEIFEWQGKFYAPRCPTCKRWLQERNQEQARAFRVGTRSDQSSET